MVRAWWETAESVDLHGENFLAGHEFYAEKSISFQTASEMLAEAQLVQRACPHSWHVRTAVDRHAISST